MITPPALPGHPFGKVGASGFPDEKRVDAIGIPDSSGRTQAYGPHRPENGQVRAVRGENAGKGARGA
ncbi:hypothetical protein SCMC78_59260 [Streptomyces sp. CMC78]|uniref:Uncharacterized protein n=1 Tax=Streptomyces sp. CMC78 TaxID=3231512 RepID=A0AB33KKU4_9ACTN